MFLPRLCSTIVLLTLFIGSSFMPGIAGKICFGILAAAGVFISSLEFSRILEAKEMRSYPFFTGIFLTGVILWILFFISYRRGMLILFSSLVLFAVVCWIFLLCSRNQLEVLKKVFHSAGIFLMLGIPFIVVALIYALPPVGRKDSVHKVFFYFILATKTGDIGAYAVGSLFNHITKGHNHKLIPSISPGKSWEGLIGGWVISMIFSVLLLPWALSRPELPVWIGLLFGTVLFFGCAAGDLSESSLKRICGVKDSGKIIPGIGGVMDLIDSLLLNAPIFYFMLTIFVLYYRK